MGNKNFASEGRYTEFYNNPVISLIRSNKNGEVEAIQTSENILYSRRAVVIAAGAWSGSLMQRLAKSHIALDVPVKPQKGHLLLLENFNRIKLNHGLMEVGYSDYQVVSHASSTIEHEQSLSSISMTATTDMMGNLILGSSRQFTGFNTELDDFIIRRIWERAGEFFPNLGDLALDLSPDKQIQMGHRPYMPDGKPIIGPVPGMPKVLLATGHEGGGLCMALGTAEMVADMILSNGGKINHSPFSVQGRCCR